MSVYQDLSLLSLTLTPTESGHGWEKTKQNNPSKSRKRTSRLQLFHHPNNNEQKPLLHIQCEFAKKPELGLVRCANTSPSLFQEHMLTIAGHGFTALFQATTATTRNWKQSFGSDADWNPKWGLVRVARGLVKIRLKLILSLCSGNPAPSHLKCKKKRVRVASAMKCLFLLEPKTEHRRLVDLICQQIRVLSTCNESWCCCCCFQTKEWKLCPAPGSDLCLGSRRIGGNNSLFSLKCGGTTRPLMALPISAFKMCVLLLLLLLLAPKFSIFSGWLGQGWHQSHSSHWRSRHCSEWQDQCQWRGSTSSQLAYHQRHLGGCWTLHLSAQHQSYEEHGEQFRASCFYFTIPFWKCCLSLSFPLLSFEHQ